jgi:16S rRNA uridine-516 pseudouridylate synthase and related pseudouridylate synthases
MCEYFGYRVVFLKRIRIMNVGLGSLQPGEFRELTRDEEAGLRRLCRNDA